jgi:hypothetical protein
MININSIDTYQDRVIYTMPVPSDEDIKKILVEKHQGRSLAAFGNGITSLITAYLYYMLYNIYSGNYFFCGTLLFFLYLNLIIYLYISIKVIFRKTGIMQYFDTGNKTICYTIVILAIYYLCIKKIPAFNNTFASSFSDFNEKSSFWSMTSKYIPIILIKLTTDGIFKSVEQKLLEKNNPNFA